MLGFGRTGEEWRCLRQLLAGADAWPRFWDLFGRVILAELKQLGLSEPPERDDVFQELALKLLGDDLRIIRNYVSQPKRASFAALLRVVVRNLALDYLRRRERRAALPLLERDGEEGEGGAITTGGWAGDPGANLNGKRLPELLRRVTGGNGESESYRIMYLRFVEQEDVNLIAERCGLKPNTVTQRIRYYLAKLRDEYSAELEELGDG